MARKGTKKNPIIVRVQTEEKLHEVALICHENGWHFIAGLAPDKPEDLADLERALNPPAPAGRANVVGRNDACPCGSGKKYKHCCMRQSQ
ncbi:MAG TPA: zinc chelation protein SecC [Chloroflexi bacterium]|nr:zinc chelation protein SecC [Chloroflexota bacterium]